jgi:membrane protein implicated in regulation of membrane protease activity
MVLVVHKQFRLLRKQSTYYITLTKIALLILSLAVLFGNVIPVVIDYATAFAGLTRSARHINAVGVAYSMDSALTAMLSSAAIWAIYRFAELAARHDDQTTE